MISGDVTGRPPLERSNGADSYELMDSWVASCLTHHEDCRRTISDLVIDETEKSALPTRVIQIEPEDGGVLLRLVQTEGHYDNYIALSHCWGDTTNHPLQTTSASLEAHLTNIPQEQLSRTFQDAVAITRALGLRYLWIDSLCIIQDDIDDWRRESSTMGRIYERARLTIAACYARNSSEGCFSQREALPPAVELSHIDKFGIQRGSIFTTLLPSEREEVDENLNPLDTRAWTTQEWLLSRRMILCLKECLAWSCKTITQVETGHSTSYISTRDSSWPRLVEKFSMRDLTFLSDRLMALEGVKSEVQKMKTKHGIYAYGLWENGLPSNLLWFPKSRANRSTMPLRIPSWSWASTSCPIKFVARWVEEKEPFRCTAAFTGMGSLVIEGYVREVPQITGLALSTNADPISKSVTHSVSLFFGVPAHLICDGRHEPIGFAIFDEYQRPGDRPVYCLAVSCESYRFHHPCEDGHTFFVLLLQTMPSCPDTFTRIGLGGISPPFWFADTRPRKINVI